jgi:hypothetical protein
MRNWNFCEMMSINAGGSLMTATYVHFARISDVFVLTVHLVPFRMRARLLICFSSPRLVEAPHSAHIFQVILVQCLKVNVCHVRDIIVAEIFSSLLKDPLHSTLGDLLIPQRIRPTRPKVEFGCGTVRRLQALFALFVGLFIDSYVIGEVFCTCDTPVDVPVCANNGLV